MESQNWGNQRLSTSRTPVAYDTLIRQSRKLGQEAILALEGASQGARQIFGQRTKQVKVSDIDELKQVVAHSQEIIAGARTVLPFVFPHEIILDRTKITIIKRIFFWSSDVISIRIEDVLNVSSSVGPLFGSVTIASRVMSTIDHFEVDRFWRDDANRIKQIIQGYLIARQNGVETDHLSCEELAKTLYELGPNKQAS
jgi:hypothetical protein